MRNQVILQPEYMSRFECIGPKCEDSCCSGWKVTLDADTYKKYTKAQDDVLSPMFDKLVTRNRSNATASNYAKIKMTTEGHCPFLSEEKLCQIQMKLGESYLSNTCATYPRTINQLDEILERSAAMSCPEIARLALLNPDGISFDEIQEEISVNSMQVNNRKDTKALSKGNKIVPYFWELRIFSIEVLQHRSYSVDERLIFLGMFYQKLQQLVSNDRVSEIPQTVERYKLLLEQGDIKNDLEQIPSNVAIQMKLSKELMDQRLSGGINNKRYMDCLIQYLNGIKYYKESTVEENANRYQEAYEHFYAPYMKEHEYIMENFLVNHVFRKMFPLTSEKSVFDAYVMLVVHYALIKLHLIGLAGYHKGLNEDIIVKFVQSFSRMVEHNVGYTNKIYNLLKENEYTTMPYMSILIKN